MLVRIFHNIVLFLTVLFCLGLYGCMFYHNTTAYYNAYFLAEERYNEVENRLNTAYQDDYNQILYVLPLIDTTEAAAEKTNLEYVIQKASLPIQYHEQSKWVDDCYLLIAKTRNLLGDYAKASSTYKYVYTESKDPNARHAALIGLLHTYTSEANMEMIQLVMEYIRKEETPFSIENERAFYVKAAHFYRINKNYKASAEYLEKAVAVTNRKKEKGRYHFILGQIYQKLGVDTSAYKNFKEVLGCNPGYELDFNARLLASRSYSSQNGGDPAEVERYFQALTKDQKNREYLDKVYYEWADFQIKRGYVDKGIALLNTSIEKSISNDKQRAYSYIRLGEVHYELKRDFPKSALYYDSALQILGENSPEFVEIQKTTEKLQAFGEAYERIGEIDTLLALSSLSESELKAYFEYSLEKDKQAVDKAIEDSKKRSASGATNPFENASQGNRWYFYNQTAVDQGRSNFRRIWGERKNEDFWRYAQKNSFSSSETTDMASKDPDDPEVKYAGLPSPDERLKSYQESLKKKDDWIKDKGDQLYYVAKVYYQDFEDPKNAHLYFQRFVTEHATDDRVPESLYNMYLICSSSTFCDSAPLEDILKKSFPKSLYTKMLSNASYAESSTSNSEEDSLYSVAYLAYEQADYQKAQQICEQLLKESPVSQKTEKIAVLRAMTFYPLRGKEAYIRELERLKTEFPTGEMASYVNKLIEAAK